MKKGIQLVALLLAAFMGSCTGGKDKAAVAAQADEKPIVKLADELTGKQLIIKRISTNIIL